MAVWCSLWSREVYMDTHSLEKDVSMSMQVLMEIRRGQQIPWNWSEKWLSDIRQIPVP